MTSSLNVEIKLILVSYVSFQMHFTSPPRVFTFHIAPVEEIKECAYLVRVVSELTVHNVVS